MTFTDEDLKRLKESLVNQADTKGFKALIARLEAAERVMNEFVLPENVGRCRRLLLNNECSACDAVIVWRKAAGR